MHLLFKTRYFSDLHISEKQTEIQNRGRGVIFSFLNLPAGEREPKERPTTRGGLFEITVCPLSQDMLSTTQDRYIYQEGKFALWQENTASEETTLSQTQSFS